MEEFAILNTINSRAQPTKPGILGYSVAELQSILQEKLSIPERYRAEQIFRWLYAERAERFDEMTNLPKSLQSRLTESFEIQRLKLEAQQLSSDGTRKFLFQLSDGRSIESVLIPSEMRDELGEAKRRTLCVSTQVGCPLDCKFCATASMKLKRNLSTAEILLQILEVERSTGEEITNLVYMGMGEPMLNYENVVNSIRIITDPLAQMVSRRRITVSTSGFPDEIREFAGEGLNVKLALSLHATTNGLRTKLMPINKKYPLEEVLAAVEDAYKINHIPVTYEYILFAGLNDNELDAKRLAKIARRVPSNINVIPFHPIDFTNPEGFAASLQPTDRQTFERFIAMLKREGAQVMVRLSSGVDIEAACGQLAITQPLRPEEVMG